MNNTKVLNFDSCFSNYEYDANNTSGITYSPYYASYNLSQVLKNVMKISLISIEIPLLFNNIRTSTIQSQSLNYLAFEYTKTGQQSTTITKFSLNVTENTYNNVNTLCTVINDQLASGLTGFTVTFSVSITNKIIINTTGLTYFKLLNDSFEKLSDNSLKFIYPRCAYPFMNKILGFSDGATGLTLQASNRYNLNIDNYLNFIIMNVPTNNSNVNNFMCNYKIGLNATNGSIYYNFQNSTYNQDIEINDVNYILNKFIVRIKDRYNNDINAQGADYSFTLKIEYK